MPRIKLELPPTFSFSTILPVRITDVNYGGHLGNDAILSMIHEARVQFLKKYGYSEMQVGSASLIMGDVAIEFKAEAFYGEQLKASVAVGEFTRAGFELYYMLTKHVNGKHVVVANAKTGLVCYDYQLKKVVSVPDGVKATLTES